MAQIEVKIKLDLPVGVEGRFSRVLHLRLEEPIFSRPADVGKNVSRRLCRQPT